MSVHGALEAPERSYDILMLLPCASKSHRNVFMPLATALTQRGHKVTMLSTLPPADNNPDITYVDHGLKHFDTSDVNMFEATENESEMFKDFEIIFSAIAKEIYGVPAVWELYKNRHKFDLIIINHLFSEVNLAVPTSVFHPRPLQKLFIYPRWDVFLESFYSILTLLNTHFSFGLPVPLLPNQVEVGGMHLRPAKPLPQDLDSFLSGTTPVVYMSLGSIARSSTIPPDAMNVIISVFAKLPYKVIWKYEEELSDIGPHVFIKKWMPQQDILAHPNVKVFISHCGLLGSQEAIYHQTPILGLPVFGDQPRNAMAWQNAGIAIHLQWKTLTEESFRNAIVELISNPKYQEKVKRMSENFRDQISDPVERAVYWTEYVIRHHGALHLRSPAKDLTWTEFLFIDLIILLHVIFVLLFYILKKALKFCFQSKNKTYEKRKNKRE
ncbi:UDP-glycosyltransferase UGT5-like [Hyalella azteca]|uniref:UDP-glucuronosyltransferase n=1 Tax=Hyalella azteca TaxID=294128 RepID=A0A8B7NHM1_HYAAZ|nr:UDP-glycosyltransferase UGT5-like [Hyalella azteca]